MPAPARVGEAPCRDVTPFVSAKQVPYRAMSAAPASGPECQRPSDVHTFADETCTPGGGEPGGGALCLTGLPAGTATGGERTVLPHRLRRELRHLHRLTVGAWSASRLSYQRI